MITIVPEASPATPRQIRFARLGAVLARGVVAGEVEATDALRVLRHELRRMNVNRALYAPFRSVGAQAAIDRYAAAGTTIPKNGSDDSLHCDHVNALGAHDLEQLTTVESWLDALPDLTAVVCVTAAENYSLEQIERTGVTGWAKYEGAGITVEPTAMR